ncbi:hypothetical protein PFTANZ_00184, partial [Plasmodium falciparum Tanzania (2000708)]
FQDQIQTSYYNKNNTSGNVSNLIIKRNLAQTLKNKASKGQQNNDLENDGLKHKPNQGQKHTELNNKNLKNKPTDGLKNVKDDELSDNESSDNEKSKKNLRGKKN